MLQRQRSGRKEDGEYTVSQSAFAGKSPLYKVVVGQNQETLYCSAELWSPDCVIQGLRKERERRIANIRSQDQRAMTTNAVQKIAKPIWSHDLPMTPHKMAGNLLRRVKLG